MFPKPLFFLTVLVMFSCNNNDKEKPAERKIAKPDSTIVRNQPVNPFAPADISPMDLSYLPSDYPQRKMSDSLIAPPVARVIYSRPQLQGRKMFGNILKYGEPWRLGANEATEIQFFQPVTVMGKQIKAGRYSLYCIPYEKEWTIAINKNIDTWGLKIDSTKDLHRFKVQLEDHPYSLEYFTIVFENTSSGSNILFGWDTTVARLPIQY